jgi:hypothetical protein
MDKCKRVQLNRKVYELCISIFMLKTKKDFYQLIKK